MSLRALSGHLLHRKRGGSPNGKLIYSAITSVDGYIEDERGQFDWAAPDDDVHGEARLLADP
jgi:hypothetical protein